MDIFKFVKICNSKKQESISPILAMQEIQQKLKLF